METEIPLVVAETIAQAEKKVAMALDDIIKLSKRNAKVDKGKKPRRGKNKNQNFNGAARSNTSKVRHYASSLSTVRQGAVAKRRSSFHGNQFPATTNIARKAATTAPPLRVHGRAFNAGRMTNVNQPRLIAPQVQNRSVHTSFIAKRHEVDQKVEKGGKKMKTLDSRFASIIEQRKSNNNNNYGVGVQVPRMPPWARARRFTY
ncbi:unnamed protein product [Thlaspi arvense]|uniref:Uncharacterized protein n=1 Tax=Thlaspi arvense TaxID=13288 RepID=A0AAU9T1L9_THLAR|nr:unnamed protein product [Thlaspi arvense]